ncbi:hypothetical protein ISF_01312 [Cordyceps fumosorosea ARSEF 2679]|uniref:Uncharacterized protein n=1 Tax=Cordyceps fumosorosea (strain ARSEF 2679) TaxID=1081104 RepID=A0A162MXJ3_CORFA|nr:hypothetical protein ISF_01312 [Cordyceps fumosorosea ARSEF 2679]OAA72239.1 hypothetical protein ISF_01312 [Cordyceps fumosorosea ARSEF 2679]
MTCGSSNPPVQPTYTTAGTIYNPSSSQPLQPPTRRGRSLKWTSGGAYSDLCLLPRSVVAYLQTKNNDRNSPYSAAQYTPLQQNYDRAANPIGRNGYLDDMRSTWTGTPSREVDEIMGYSASDRDHDGDDEDEDEDDGMDSIMMNMPVKSLHNLASYPNPNQRKARKVLFRPLKPRLNLQHTYSANEMPSQHWDARPSLDPVYDRYWAKPRLSNSDSVASQLMARAELQGITERGQREGQSPPPKSESSEQSSAWLTHLALGAPRPLTAGPPGQRQYRASTFKSTFKALSTDSKAAKPLEEDVGYAVTARVLQHAGIDDAQGKLADSLSRQESEASFYTQLFQGSQILPAGSPNGSCYGTVGSPDKGKRRCDADEFAGLDPEAEGPEWRVPSRCVSIRSRTNPEYQAGLAAYMERVNRWWYSGCERLCDEEALEAGRAQAWCVGVIGDGRQGQTGRNRHARLGTEEANKMDAAEHAKPLLEMAVANLERNFEGMMKSRGG